ncbi:MAG TPA: DUF2167 domain-containing protein [Verrucomicrobiae bacterium]|nr:DUF2167 domain-containing protein [Verrucomicrobiae bacterium]
MQRIIAGLFGLMFVAQLFAAAPADPKPNETAEEKEDREEREFLKSIDWQKGPADADIGKYAKIKVPDGYMFTGAAGTQKLLEAGGNPTNGDELGFLAPTNMAWFVVFEFSDDGYVKDDDKDKLDPQKLLTAIKRGNEQGNKLRKKMGSAPLKIIGWEVPPTYNSETKNLEWAIRAESEGHIVINYNTRLLGREGVMEAALVIKPEKLQEALPTFQSLLTGYHYKSGHTYAEYRNGDKLAKYGLAALITGGAAAVAVKTGLLSAIILFFKKGAKLIVVAAVAIGAFFKKLIFGRGRDEMTS